MLKATDAEVVMYSCFAELPDHVLNSCLRLTSFEDKLRCQQVCTSWRSLFNRSAASGDTCETSLCDVWGRILTLYVSEPTEGRARTQVDDFQSEHARTVVYLITTKGPLSVHNEAFLHWISHRAVAFPTVHIAIKAVLPAQLMPHLAAALKAAAALAPSRWQLQLDAGEKTWATKLHLSKADEPASLQVLSKLVLTHTVPRYAGFDVTDPQNGCQQLAGVVKDWQASIANIQQLSCLTQLTHLSCTANSEVGFLEELQQLSLLQKLTLSRLYAVPRDVHNFRLVQSLSLHGIEEQLCNTESYTQLTHLRISIQSKDTVKEILLPAGFVVKLRSLDIWGPCHEHIINLKNLTFATQLEDMRLYSASPQNIKQLDLSALPFLTRLQLMDPNCALLQTVPLCSSLQSLYVSAYEQTALPSTFSLMTQLKVLILRGCSFAQFPACLLHLSQLESLCVSCNKPAFRLSNSILGLANWPNLKSLDISDCCGSQFPVESQLLLGQLQKQLRDCNSCCKFNSGW